MTVMRLKNQRVEPSWQSVLRSSFSQARRVAVLGIGRRDQGDDGAGSRLVQALTKSLAAKASKNLLLVDCGVAPENFTGVIRRFAPSHILIVDAASAGRRPGEIYTIEPGSVQEEELSTHRLPIGFLVRYLRETLACEFLILGIQPARFDSLRLSPAVKKSCANLFEFLSCELGSKK